MTYRVAVDIGGTFTDFCVFNENNSILSTHKVLSTPDNPGSEIALGVLELKEKGLLEPEQVSWFSHGTTVGINTVIQRSGAKLALFVTQGFEDVLEVARLKVPDPYNIFSRRADPLVPRERVFGVPERTLKDGSVDTELNESIVEDLIKLAKKMGSDTIVVSLLHSYANNTHERRIRELINSKAPEMAVTLSSDVWPVIREYERTVTTTVAGYVQRRVANYLTAFQDALKSAQITATAMIGKSNGGVMTAELGKSDPISMLLSGTATGVIGAAEIAKKIGTDSILSFDVGGTSADVAVISNGEPAYSSGEMVGDFPIYVPTVSVTSIGEGGGSIAWVDAFGVLKVGPESAGSNPGPACYNQGGTRPTITDAFSVLGLLGEGKLGYGKVQLNIDAAVKALQPITDALSMDVKQAAQSIIDVAVSGMFLETTKLLSRFGADPRNFSLLPFGGAGPMIGCLLAKEMGLRDVIIPPTPGVLSAYGGLIADIRNDFIRTIMIDVSEDTLLGIKKVVDELEAEAENWLRAEQGFDGKSELLWSADMRYRGQSYEIETSLDKNWLNSIDINSISTAFHKAHHEIYEHSDLDAEIQIVNLRLVISGEVSKPQFLTHSEKIKHLEPSKTHKIYIEGKEYDASLFDRVDLEAGHYFAGPAIISQDDTTTIVLPEFDVKVDKFKNLIISKRA
ncbi:MAG: hydantoinase/oxoprolinase family protein [Paracoccaceae bacterium]